MSALDSTTRPDSTATITVPAALADEFKQELLGDIEGAADEVEMAARKAQLGEDETPEFEFGRMYGAIGLHHQAMRHETGDLVLTGDREAMRSVAIGRLAAAAEDVHVRVEATRFRGPVDIAPLREAIDRLVAWTDLAEEIA